MKFHSIVSLILVAQKCTCILPLWCCTRSLYSRWKHSNCCPNTLLSSTVASFVKFDSSDSLAFVLIGFISRWRFKRKRCFQTNASYNVFSCVVHSVLSVDGYVSMLRVLSSKNRLMLKLSNHDKLQLCIHDMYASRLKKISFFGIPMTSYNIKF